MQVWGGFLILVFLYLKEKNKGLKTHQKNTFIITKSNNNIFVSDNS